MKCEECEKGKLVPSKWTGYFDIRGYGKLVVHGLECYKCDNCDADPVYTDQIERNEKRVQQAKERNNKKLFS